MRVASVGGTVRSKSVNLGGDVGWVQGWGEVVPVDHGSCRVGRRLSSASPNDCIGSLPLAPGWVPGALAEVHRRLALDESRNTHRSPTMPARP